MYCPDVANTVPNLERIPILFEAETGYMTAPGYSDSDQSIATVRRRAMFAPSNRNIFWYGYNYEPLVRHYAVTYFDNYVSRSPLQQNTARFIMLCSAVLAWKMHTRDFKLKNYVKEHEIQHLIKRSDTIRELESEILTKLNWRMPPVTSLSFLDFFIHICNIEGEDAKRMYKLSTIDQAFPYNERYIEFTQFKPSIIAASGLLFVAAPTKDHQIYYESIASSEYVDKEDLDRCISIMASCTEMERFRQRQIDMLKHGLEALSLEQREEGEGERENEEN